MADFMNLFDNDLVQAQPFDPCAEEVENNVQTPINEPIPVQDQPIQAERIKNVNNQPNTVQASNQQSNVQVLNQINQDPMDILYNVSSTYTDNQWALRENIYVNECNKIRVDTGNVSNNDVIIAAGQIDRLLTPLVADNISAQRLSAKYENLLKLEKELCFNSVKQQAGTKLTVDETKSLIAMTISNKRQFEDNKNLYELCERYGSRYIFTKGILDCLHDKKDLLINYLTILKLENSTQSMSPNVYSQNQMNRMN